MKCAARNTDTPAADIPLMTLEQVAAFLQLSERTVYMLAQKGEIPAFKLGNLWRFKRSDLDAWIEEQKEATQRKEA